MNFALLFTAIVATLATVVPSNAQPHSSTEAAPDETRLALAREVVALVNPTGLTKNSIQPMLQEMRSGRAIQQHADLVLHLTKFRLHHPKEWDETFRRLGGVQADFTEKAFDEAAPKALDNAVNGYAQKFSAEDFRALIAFYRSPAGVHARERQPLIGNSATAEFHKYFDPIIQQQSIKLYPQIDSDLRQLIITEAHK